MHENQVRYDEHNQISVCVLKDSGDREVQRNIYLGKENSSCSGVLGGMKCIGSQKFKKLDVKFKEDVSAAVRKNRKQNFGRYQYTIYIF